MTVYPLSFAAVCMAALFTGIVLTLEMAANVTFLLTLLTACFTVMLIPVLLVARRFLPLPGRTPAQAAGLRHHHARARP